VAHSSEQQRSLARIGDLREDPLEKLGRLYERDRALGFLGGTEARVDGLFRPAGSEQVARDLRCCSVRPCEGIGGAGMDPLPLRDDGVARDRLLGECVAPAVAVARVSRFFQELLRDGGLESRENAALLDVRHRDEQSVVERATKHGGCSQHLDLPSVEPAQAQQHRLADRLRHLQRSGRASLPAGVGSEDLAPVERFLQHFLEDEWITLGASVDEGSELGVHLVGVQDCRNHLGDLRWRHCGDGDRLRESCAPPNLNRAGQGMAPVELVAPVRGEHHHPAPDEPSCHVVEKLTRRAVGPVDVVEDEEQAAIAGPVLEERYNRLEEAQLCLRRVAHGRRRRAFRELRKELGELRSGRA